MTLAQAQAKILVASTTNADLLAAVANHLITIDGSGNVSTVLPPTALVSTDEIQFAQALPGLPQ